jgi:hypothetical protein
MEGWRAGAARVYSKEEERDPQIRNAFSHSTCFVTLLLAFHHMVAADYDIDAINAQDVQTQPTTRKSRSTLTDHVFPPFYACYLLKSMRTPRSTG